jgi:ParB family transcriptional regulator, chromosome partitioning protein
MPDIAVDKIDTDPGQPRKFYDECELRQLGENIRDIGQLQEIVVRQAGDRFQLVAGERRLRAVRLVSLKTIRARIENGPESQPKTRIAQLSENIHRADLTPYEKWLACAELMCMHPNWKLQDLAKALSLDPSMVTRLLSPSKCIEAVQHALRDGKINGSDCYAISKAPQPEQADLLAARLA